MSIRIIRKPPANNIGKNAACASCEIFYEYWAWPCLLPISRHDLAKAMAAMQVCTGIICNGLWLVDDRTIANLNEDLLGCVGPTNILSFPEDPGSGSLVLSLDTFAREAWLFNQPKAGYLIRLLAHGFGHLPGNAHGPELDAIAQECEKAALNPG